MTDLIRRIPWPGRDDARAAPAGDPASGWSRTGSAATRRARCPRVMTRRYHGLLIAALPAPLGRMIMLSHLHERLGLPDGSVAATAAAGSPADRQARGGRGPAEFRLELACPCGATSWAASSSRSGCSSRTARTRSTSAIGSSPGPGPSVSRCGRPSTSAPTSARCAIPSRTPTASRSLGDRYELLGSPDFPPLRLRTHGPRPPFTSRAHDPERPVSASERSRGYEAPATSGARATSAIDPRAGAARPRSSPRPSPGRPSTRSTRTRRCGPSASRRQRLPRGRPSARPHGPRGGARAGRRSVPDDAGRPRGGHRASPRATGDEARTIIAGYHWFTDWGRDTMIGLEGLTLVHRAATSEAGYILRTFAHYVRDGLIPNMFPEGTREGLYHTADATLWYFHALDRYLRRPAIARRCGCFCPTLLDDRRAPPARHAVRHRRRPGGRAAAPGRGRVPAHLDGCQGRATGWSRRGAARRSRSTRSGTTRCGCSRAGYARSRATMRRRRCRARASQVRGIVQRALLVRRGRLPLRRGRRRGRRRSRLPAQPALRDLAAAPGAGRGALGAGPRRGPASAC